MPMTDPIADMLTRIRNAQMVRHPQIELPSSKTKVAVAEILKREGYLVDVEVVKRKPQDMPGSVCATTTAGSPPSRASSA